MSKSAKKALIYLLEVIGVVVVLSLAILILNLYLANPKPQLAISRKEVLGAADNSRIIDEKDFWQNYLTGHPGYLPGWVELAKIEKILGNQDGFDHAKGKIMAIDPNFENTVNGD